MERETTERDQTKNKKERKRDRSLCFLPPALHVVDGWRSRGLATGDSIIFLATRSRGYAKGAVSKVAVSQIAVSR